MRIVYKTYTMPDKKIELDPPKDLLPRILSKLQREQELRAIKRNLVFSSIVFLFFSTLGYFLSPYIVKDSQVSEFSKYFSLLFSNFKDVSAHSDVFIQSLLESLPAVDFAVLLALALGISTALAYLAKQIKSFVKINNLRKNN